MGRGRSLFTLSRLLRLAALGLAMLCALFAALSFFFRHRPFAGEGIVLARSTGKVATGLSIVYHGVSCYEISDGTTTLLTDPGLTRFTLGRLLAGPIAADPRLAERIPQADFILINHAHYDHILDVGPVAQRTGATVLGSASALNIARSQGVPAHRLRQIFPGQELELGSFVVQVHGTQHTDIMGRENPMAGTSPFLPGNPPRWFFDYKQDANFVFHLRSAEGSLWFHPTAVLKPELFTGAADILVLGMAELEPERIGEFLRLSGARVMVPTHFDNFLQPLSRGLALLPTVDLRAAERAVKAHTPPVSFVVLDYGARYALPRATAP